MIAPSLLTEDLFFMINVRIKDRVQVDMHQILKILIVAARHRITGLVRICHGVQERIQGSFDQFYERILKRKFPGSAENTVFENMRHSCAVLRRSSERDIEHLILVLVFNEHDSGACFFMTQKITCGTDIPQVFFFHDLICCYFISVHCCLRF